jgi:hypothetical protein
MILGGNGLAITAAAGVLLTATGTAGALAFAGWAGIDHLAGLRRRVVKLPLPVGPTPVPAAPTAL